MKQGSLLTLPHSGPCTHLQSLCFSSCYSHFTSNIPPSSTIGLHQFLLSPRSKKVASELRGGQPVQGHLDGGRACLLAMRVSRSVLLSVCEAVIRFQDFPSVTGLLTKPCTPLHEDNHHHHHHLTHPNSLGCYTSAGWSHSHLQPHPKPPHSN